jgi:hypothetical protein
MPAIRVMRNNRGKRPKLDPEIKMFSEEDVKGEEDSDEDFDIQATTKHESPSTSKKGTVVKRTKNKGMSMSQNPRRNSTRVTNKYRLKSKAMFNPSIKEENVIVIEDHSKDALLEGLQLGVSLSLMARTTMAKISMINSAVIMEE